MFAVENHAGPGSGAGTEVGACARQPVVCLPSVRAKLKDDVAAMAPGDTARLLQKKGP